MGSVPPLLTFLLMIVSGWVHRRPGSESEDVQAFLAAFKGEIETIQRDRKAAAEFYLRVSKDKMSVDDIPGMLNDPRIMYTMAPQNTIKYAEFMDKIGQIKVKPTS